MRLYVPWLVILIVVIIVDALTFLYIHRSKLRNSVSLTRWVLLFSGIFFFYFLSISLLSPVYARADGGNLYLHFFITITWFVLWYVPRILLLALYLAFIIPITYFKSKSAKHLFYTLALLFLIVPLAGVVISKQVMLERFQPVKFPLEGTSFNGYRVVQFSDMHLGTMPWAASRWKEHVERINRLSPDLIVFTGDLVNNFWTETIGWDSIFSTLKATDGKVAILGNHDYGDYVRWKTPYDKFYNKEKVLAFFRKNGFKVLNNEHFPITRNANTLIVAGVENWGHSIFPKYSNLKEALHGIDKDTPVLLLSHNPDHWEKEVLTSDKNIFLTLSGHTHGLQTGLRIRSVAISPARWKYKFWGGYYFKNDKQLYVSTGVGYIAFMGRIGIWPEIVVLDFQGQ